jgi:hypothetical protein
MLRDEESVFFQCSNGDSESGMGPVTRNGNQRLDTEDSWAYVRSEGGPRRATESSAF